MSAKHFCAVRVFFKIYMFSIRTVAMVKGSATNSEEINDKIKCKCRESVGCGGGTREILEMDGNR